MFKDIYILLDGMNQEEIDEISKFNFLYDAKNTQEIMELFYSKDNSYEENEKKMGLTTSLEYFMFVYYLRSKGYKNIKTLINPSLFIYNDGLYEIKDEKIIELDIKEVGFFSLRGINSQHPFFFILKTLISSKGGKSSKPNELDMSMMTTRGKFHSLNSLYKKRKKYIGNIIIVHEIKKSQYEIFQKFIADKMGNHILIKKDFRSCGLGNYPIDFEDFNESQQKKFNIALERSFIKYEAAYIVAIEDFSEEYRVYFTKVKGKIKIHSIKRKIINVSRDEILSMEVFKYGGMFDWGYISNDERKNIYKQESIISKKLIKNLDYTNGILEFGKTIDGNYVFLEVNGMGAVMPYKGEDINNIKDYYKGIFKNLFI